MKEEHIRWLSSLSKKDVLIAGGKGAHLGEMYNLGLPIPQAFVITTKAFHHFVDKTNIKEEINHILSKINIEDKESLLKKSEEIRNLIITTQMPEDLEKEILDSYDTFNIDLDEMKNSSYALAIMKTAREPIFVSVRASPMGGDFQEASFAGQQESFINIKGNKELIEKVKRVFASIFTARSIYYRMVRGFDAFSGISVVVQKMINSDKSGIMFSVNPVTHEGILVEAIFGQGKGIVSGQIKPDSYTLSKDLEITSEKISDKEVAIVRDSSGITKTVPLNEEKSKKKVLQTHEIKQLGEYALKLERHYQKPQDIEFALEDGEIFILESRDITTLEDKKEKQELEGQVIVKGMPASTGIGSGTVRIVNSIEDLHKIKEGDVLVTQITNPDMVVFMQKASAIVTDEGGITAHTSIVSREMGIPTVVGTTNATSKLEDGMEVTVDGFSGKVFLGRAENRKVEILPIVETKTKIKVLIDLPEFAERAAKTNANGVGLVRLEGIIASSGKHPLLFEENKNTEEYKEIIKKGLEKIAEQFIGEEIWVRSSDLRSDEYSNLEGAPKEIERNPMLGMHGIRFSLKHLEIFKAEMLAIKELVEKGHKFGLMFPQIISVEELKKAKKIMNELGLIESKVKIGVMVETPAAVIIIKDLCKEGMDFISFGTNDLTQYTLAIDRGNEQVQYMYNELDWAVRKQLSRVIRECKFHKIETSICGQAGSNKEMVDFLVREGIDSISVNADVAREISEFVKELEEKI